MKKYRNYFILYGTFLLYSFATVFSKIASQYKLLSYQFILFYGCMLSLLMIYAILWQQILKKFNLGVAYANKAVTIVFGLLWGVLFFEETLTFNKILGIIIIIIGVYLVVGDHG